MVKAKRKRSKSSANEDVMRNKENNDAAAAGINNSRKHEETLPTEAGRNDVKNNDTKTKLSRLEQQHILDSFVQSLASSIVLSDKKSTSSSAAVVLCISSTDKDTTTLTNALTEIPTSLSMLRELVASNINQCSRQLKLLLAKRLMQHHKNVLVREAIFYDSNPNEKSKTSEEEPQLAKVMKSYALYICLIWRFPTVFQSIIANSSTTHTRDVDKKNEPDDDNISIAQEIFSLILMAISRKYTCNYVDYNESNNKDTLIRMGLLTRFIVQIAAHAEGEDGNNHIAVILHNALSSFVGSSQIFRSIKHKLPSPKLVHSLRERLQEWAQSVLQNYDDQYLSCNFIIADATKKEVKTHAVSEEKDYRIIKGANTERQELVQPSPSLALNVDDEVKTSSPTTIESIGDMQNRIRADSGASLSSIGEDSKVDNDNTSKHDSAPQIRLEDFKPVTNSALPPRVTRRSVVSNRVSSQTKADTRLTTASLSEISSTAVADVDTVAAQYNAKSKTPSLSKEKVTPKKVRRSDRIAKADEVSAPSIIRTPVSGSPMTRRRSRSDATSSSV
jgi:hypothetical protein